MDQQEAIKIDYLKKKRQFEEKEEDILFQRDQGIRAVEEIADRTHYYLKDYVPDQEFIIQAVHKLDRLKEEVYEAAQQDRKQIERKVEELDDTYYRDIRTLSD
ncbi:hypothetical protein UAY_03244 [Enterococcus moraviensis ATCC BAA-383]|uniref:Uncharacterized protein n=1 Tax=Enterococcus moraviensis ATCC BAA-383 TaxID=1158609 RepID=R2QKW1_9ENTE|nr:hypothetical protein [Enterococcus moraviensis]EOH95818.1 hypothetical protein UAY_03244 [Enterococcus moraviensis ATCC BAA-383]EOT66305.1 hypothetical protein I586_02576 [Enterococcus moraviensis ATCC BAA-383]OJG67631.1 hypothetical protein RV09_GL002400 [Enterococcus moraviensis]